MNVTSTLDSVTVYRDAAVCVRRALLEPKDGAVPAQVRIVGLPLAMVVGSVRARVVKGPITLRVLDVRPTFDVEFVGEVDVPAEAKALQKAQDNQARLVVAAERLAAEITEIESLRPLFSKPKRGDPPREAPVSSMLALADFVAAQLDEKLARQRALKKELEQAAEEVFLRERRLQEASTANRTERARVSRAATVHLSAESIEPVELAVEYQVPGVRWAPGYELRLKRGSTGGELTMRASVAQATGEDWVGVALALSTGSLGRSTDVPELKALKIGRRQSEPTRSGWREPPPGLEELFDGYDAARSLVSAPPQSPAGEPVVADKQVGSEGEEYKKATLRANRKERGRAQSKAPMAQSMPLPAPMPPRSVSPMVGKIVAASASVVGEITEDESVMQASIRRSAVSKDMEVAGSLDRSEIGEESAITPPDDATVGLEPAASSFLPQASLMDYDRLVMAGPSVPGARGRLAPASEWEFAFFAQVSMQVDVVAAVMNRAIQQAHEVGSLSLPARCSDPGPVDYFDYRYDCALRVDVPSTGTWTSVPVMACNVGLTPEFICVPSVEQKVYRTLQIKNTSPHALLPGPVDVFAGDEFLLTAQLPAIAPGSDGRRLGLGVEEALKVARKTHYQETTGGFLGGSTVLPHEIEIELNNRLGTPVMIEVRERVPYAPPSEKDVKVEETSVNPAWETVEIIDGEPIAGGRRWRVTVAPGQKLSLSAQFSIRMPADKMLVGGNRRI